jgi:hypothetical protein
MSKITNKETLEAKREILDLIAVCAAQLKSLDVQVRRDYRATASQTAMDLWRQINHLEGAVLHYVPMPSKEER